MSNQNVSIGHTMGTVTSFNRLSSFNLFFHSRYMVKSIFNRPNVVLRLLAIQMADLFREPSCLVQDTNLEVNCRSLSTRYLTQMSLFSRYLTQPSPVGARSDCPFPTRSINVKLCSLYGPRKGFNSISIHSNSIVPFQ